MATEDKAQPVGMSLEISERYILSLLVKIDQSNNKAAYFERGYNEAVVAHKDLAEEFVKTQKANAILQEELNKTKEELNKVKQQLENFTTMPDPSCEKAKKK